MHAIVAVTSITNPIVAADARPSGARANASFLVPDTAQRKLIILFMSFPLLLGRWLRWGSARLRDVQLVRMCSLASSNYLSLPMDWTVRGRNSAGLILACRGGSGRELGDQPQT